MIQKRVSDDRGTEVLRPPAPDARCQNTAALHHSIGLPPRVCPIYGVAILTCFWASSRAAGEEGPCSVLTTPSIASGLRSTCAGGVTWSSRALGARLERMARRNITPIPMVGPYRWSSSTESEERY